MSQAENLQKSFLIIRLSSIGDVVLTTALVRCLRASYPSARIDYVVKKEFATLLEGNPHINKVIPFDKNLGFRGLIQCRRLIAQARYTHILDLQKNIRSFLLARLQGATVSNFSKKVLARKLLIQLKWNFYQDVKPVLQRYFESVKKLGIVYDGKGTEVFPTADDQRKAMEYLPSANGLDEKWIGLAPGAQWANKRWPAENFALAAHALSETYDAPLLALGGKSDSETVGRVEQNLQLPLVRLDGKTTLMQSAAVLSRCKLLLTNDTGMMHLAQAVGTAVVAIFGPTTRQLGFFPFPPNSRVAESDVPCRPCTQKGRKQCPKGHFNCMHQVTPEMVISRSKELF